MKQQKIEGYIILSKGTAIECIQGLGPYARLGLVESGEGPDPAGECRLGEKAGSDSAGKIRSRGWECDDHRGRDFFDKIDQSLRP